MYPRVQLILYGILEEYTTRLAFPAGLPASSFMYNVESQCHP